MVRTIGIILGGEEAYRGPSAVLPVRHVDGLYLPARQAIACHFKFFFILLFCECCRHATRLIASLGRFRPHRSHATEVRGQNENGRNNSVFTPPSEILHPMHPVKKLSSAEVCGDLLPPAAPSDVRFCCNMQSCRRVLAAPQPNVSSESARYPPRKWQEVAIQQGSRKVPSLAKFLTRHFFGGV